MPSDCWCCGQPGEWSYKTIGRMECGRCGVRWTVPGAVEAPGIAANQALVAST